jgi:hypothetical protein
MKEPISTDGAPRPAGAYSQAIAAGQLVFLAGQGPRGRQGLCDRATGRPGGDAAPTIAWQLGVDVAAVAGVCGAVEAIGYAYDPDRLRVDLEARLVGDATLNVVLRPALPDCDSPQNLGEKTKLAGELDLARVDFYHYGLMRLDALDWIREAVTEL